MELSIKDLCEKIEAKNIVLPNFQREFVWKINQQKGLIASVLTSVPCTSSLVVTINNNGATNFLCKSLGYNLSQDTFEPETFPLNYLLDGQQRFTSIYFVFKNVYNHDNLIEKQDYYNKLFKNLCNRWIIKIDNECFGYENLFFNKKEFNDKIPEEIIDFIECYSDIAKKESEMFIGNDPSKIIENSCKNKYIPLFLIEDISNTNLILKKISNEKLFNYKVNKEFDRLKEIFKINNLENFDEIKEQLIDASSDEEIKVADEEFEKQFEIISKKWSANISNLLYEKITDKYLNCIELKDINKAISTFTHINNSGTKLSTFDLICSKSINLRINLIYELKVDFELNGKKVSLNENFNIYNEKTGLNSQYLDFFMHTLNIIHFIKNHVDYPNSSTLKQSYSLFNNDFNNDFIEENYKSAVKYSKIVCFILNTKLGHKEFKNVTNKLSLIPLVYFVIKKEGELNATEIEKMTTFFWVNLFSAKYSKNQSEQCIIDCRNIYEFIFNNNKLEINKLININLFKEKDFANKKSLTNSTKKEKVNSNAIKNIIYYILSEAPKDFLTHSKIDINTDDIENHHIIPLANKRSINISTKEIRNDDSNILNSIMNLTPITKVSNRKIGSLDLINYQNNLTSPTLANHHLTDDWKIQYDDTNENTIIQLFESRFDSFYNSMLNKFNLIIEK